MTQFISTNSEVVINKEKVEGMAKDIIDIFVSTDSEINKERVEGVINLFENIRNIYGKN